jgi:cell division transport system ATP-binding protein
LLKLKEVTKIFDETQIALERIDFQLDKGEFMVLVGPNQAGKTTLLKLISLEEFPTCGEIVFDGLNSRTITRKQLPFLRRKMGMVFSDFPLIDDMNAFDNVALSLRIGGVKEGKVKRQVNRTMEMVELSGKGGCFPPQLSAGEKQKVVCARAMVKEPVLLLADEPTLNLDRRSSDEILNLLRQINILGTAVLLATCDSHLRAGCHHRTIRLERGKLSMPTDDGLRIPLPV